MSEFKTVKASLPVDVHNVGSLFDKYFEQHATIAAETWKTARAAVLSMLDVQLECIRSGRMLMFFGNGGSASTAQHIAAEFVVRLKTNRLPISAIALTADSSVITAAGNDLGFEHIFARQLAAVGRPGDVAVAFTTSGQSTNVLAALDACKNFGVVPTALCGAECSNIISRADPVITVP